ncbi:MAG: hypothetical protein ABSA47_18735 [Verrucomicrobiota bacterium]
MTLPVRALRLIRARLRLDDLPAGVFTASMRMVIGVLCAATLLGGCATHKSSAPKPAPAKTVVTPDLRPVGQVELVNAQGRFVVISYPPGAVPKPGLRLNVWRNGLKVGEVKVGDQERDNNTVADILAGDVKVHDQTREE